MSEVFVVTYGKLESNIPYTDKEDGSTYCVHEEWYAVSFSTEYGIEYTHTHRFSCTEDGIQEAKRLAERVKMALDAVGLAVLNGSKSWNMRVIYGSPAYQDEEFGVSVKKTLD